MANAWCLTKDNVDKFLKGLRSGAIDPTKLSDMTSEGRHSYLSDFVGKDNATQVNALFESKLLLKNQQTGMINWAKKVAGLKPDVKRDLISRIQKMDQILNPESEKTFLQDLASTRLGADVTQQEAKNIFNLSQEVQSTKAAIDNGGNRLDYGKAKVTLMNYVNTLKEKTTYGISLNPVRTLSNVAGNAKSIRASMDNSAIFRQGWKTLMTNPLIWQRNARQTFVDIFKTFGGKKVMDELNADIVSRSNYDLMVKAKLAIGTVEEQFPGSVVEKIPIVGKVYKASENAYTGFVYRQRADIFDKYIDIAKRSGVNLNDTKELQAIGSMVNSLTGRGNAGFLNQSIVNNVFFSPRNIKSQVDTFLHPFTGAGGSNFVKKQSAINLLKIVTGTAAVLAIADIIRPGSVEKDPRSADFGKIRIGNTRFDVTGGASPIVTLAARLMTMSLKSSTTGKVIPLNSGEFGAPTAKDAIYNFFENKLSPALSVVKDLATGKDFQGNKPTLGGELSNLFVPLSISTYQELKNDPNSADTLLSMIADGLGITTNTYGKTVKDWSQNPTKAQQSFLNKVGDTKFKAANTEFNKQYDEWFSNVSTSQAYKNLSDSAKQTLLNNKKSTLQDKIFSGYGFNYAQQKSTPMNKQEKGTIKQLLNMAPSETKSLAQSIIDTLIPTAYASNGENSLFGSSTTKIDFKTGQSTTTSTPGLIEKGVKAITEFFTGKKLINAYTSSSNQSNSVSTVSPTPSAKPKIDQSGNVDFNSVIKDPNYGTRNINPQQPPPEIAAIIKKYFPNDYARAVIVAATENGQYDPTRADNINPKDNTHDRGIFQINSDTFSSLMQRAGDQLKSAGINSYQDMYDPEKNAFVASLIKEGSKQTNPQTNGWGAWYGWQNTGYDINNGWYSEPHRQIYDLEKKGRFDEAEIVRQELKKKK